jgi:hypothetical protein
MESRDEARAPVLERRVEAAMKVDGKYWAEVRSLECRRTLCVVEWMADESRNSAINAEHAAFATLRPELEYVAGGVWYQLPSTMARVKVTAVQVFRIKTGSGGTGDF